MLSNIILNVLHESNERLIGIVGFIIIAHRFVRASSCLVLKFLCITLVIIIILIIALLTIVSEDQWVDLDCLYKSLPIS